ncbi:Hypothetical protein D9617_19g101860 [Elsinoe fawcettii]|nr:Hypothetical protein D9617_19g101860 [Elsinoe fawcettii]
MSSDFKSAPPPPPPAYSGPSSYKLLESPSDEFDYIYHSASTDYLVHLTRYPDTPHLTLHHQSLSGSSLASLDYESAANGILRVGDTSDTKPIQTPWDFATLENRIDFIASGRRLRWIKTYQTERHVLRPSRRYIQYDLVDAPAAEQQSDVQEVGAKTKSSNEPQGPKLATLALLPPAKGATSANGNEIGQVTMHGDLEKSVQDGALLVVAAIVHRDRQIQKREPLGPTIDVKITSRPQIYGMFQHPGGSAAAGIVVSGSGGGAF